MNRFQLLLSSLLAPLNQGASPDEVALAEGAAAMGFRFVERTATHITVDTLLVTEPGQQQRRTWEVLNVLDFSSERQRMSIILKATPPAGSGGNTAGNDTNAGNTTGGGGEITLYCKGADSRVLSLLADDPDPGAGAGAGAGAGSSSTRRPETAAALSAAAASTQHIHDYACKVGWCRLNPGLLMCLLPCIETKTR